MIKKGAFTRLRFGYICSILHFLLKNGAWLVFTISLPQCVVVFYGKKKNYAIRLHTGVFKKVSRAMEFQYFCAQKSRCKTTYAHMRKGLYSREVLQQNQEKLLPTFVKKCADEIIEHLSKTIENHLRARHLAAVLLGRQMASRQPKDRGRAG